MGTSSTLAAGLMTIGTGFGKSGRLPPMVGMWMPNVVMGSITAIFIFRSGRERPLWTDSLIGAVGNIMDRLKRHVLTRTTD